MAGNTKVAGRSVTSKVVAILEAFMPTPRDLSLTQLSERTGLPVSTTYRLASELVEWGGLERVPAGGYRIGLRLWEIAALAAGGVTLPEVVAPHMQDLYEATHQNVQLAVLAGREALYVERLTGRRSTPVAIRRGGRLPLHATGVGKVLLAFAPPHVMDDVLAAGLAAYTPHTITSPARLRRVLADIRRSGVGFAREEMTTGTYSVAAPVSDASGEVVAALSVVVPSPHANLQRLAPAVRAVAVGATRELRSRSIRIDGWTGQSNGTLGFG